jgi:solute carrier family 25 carnitine/acylcarnitine transporter 20/29
VTAIRDSVGYGFYFWSYELSRRWMEQNGNRGGEAASVLLCGGLAGVVTWASIFPLDVIKTRVQTQVLSPETAPLLETDALEGKGKRLGAWAVAKEAYREGGIRVFFRGLAVCSVRAFIVNAVQWAAYEWIMTEFGQGRDRRKPEGQLEIKVG